MRGMASCLIPIRLYEARNPQSKKANVLEHPVEVAETIRQTRERSRREALLTAWPLASYSGHFCLILASSMLTCLLITAMGFPPKHADTNTPNEGTASPW